jgi:hypothetical protein
MRVRVTGVAGKAQAVSVDLGRFSTFLRIIQLLMSTPNVEDKDSSGTLKTDFELYLPHHYPLLALL